MLLFLLCLRTTEISCILKLSFYCHYLTSLYRFFRDLLLIKCIFYFASLFLVSLLEYFLGLLSCELLCYFFLIAQCFVDL